MSTGIGSLSLVDEAGDKSYNNGQKELSGEQQRKMNEMLRQIVQQKQNDLLSGDMNTILAKLKENTPEAALYRALLLQQLEDAVKKDKAEGNTDDKDKPGWLKRAYRWVKSKAWGVTKALGWSAAMYLLGVAFKHIPDFSQKGFSATWNQILTEHGIARTPEYAEMVGDATAAVDGDILKRNIKFSDLSEPEKIATMNFAKKEMGTDAKFDTSKAEFKLIPIFKKGNEIETHIPFGEDADSYSKIFTHVLDTGGKDGTLLPINPSTIGRKNYENLFKVGKVRTEITPEDNWFTGNTLLRTVDNGLWHMGDAYKHVMGDKGDSLKRNHEVVFGPDTDYSVLSGKKVRMEDGTIMPKEAQRALVEQEKMDRTSTAAENTNNIVQAVELGTRSIPVRYDIPADKLDDIINRLSSKDLTMSEAYELFKDFRGTTGYGVREDQMEDLIRDAISIQSEEPSTRKRVPLYQGIIDHYSTLGLPRIAGVMNPPQFNAVNYKGDPKKQRKARRWYNDPWFYTLTGLGGLGAASAFWGPAAVFGTVAKAAPFISAAFHARRGNYGQAAIDAAGAVAGATVASAAPAVAAPAAAAPAAPVVGAPLNEARVFLHV